MSKELGTMSAAEVDEFVDDVHGAIRKHFPDSPANGLFGLSYAFRLLIVAYIRKGVIGAGSKRSLGEMIYKPVKGWPEDC